MIYAHHQILRFGICIKNHLSKYPIKGHVDEIGYNSGMKRLQDSGRAKRISKMMSIKDKNLQDILNIEKSFYSNITIEQYYKKASYAILKETRNHKEKAVIFNKNGEILLEKLGNEESIVFSQNELQKLKDGYLIHNHPTGSTLSEADINLALYYDLKEIVAFSSKGVFYRLKIKNNANSKEIMIQYKKSKMKVLSIMAKVYKSGGLTKEQIDMEVNYLIVAHFAKNSKGVKYEISN